MAKIYSKTGDGGQTGLIGGKRVPKNNIRVEAYGTVDEANALLGVLLARYPFFPHREELEALQHMLFEIGAVLARHPVGQALPAIAMTENDVKHLEELIDELTADLPPQTQFILPGGSELAGWLHVVRTVVRRAERRVVTVMQHDEVPPIVVKYLNRLADYLFTLARAVNKEFGVSDVPWIKNSNE